MTDTIHGADRMNQDICMVYIKPFQVYSLYGTHVPSFAKSGKTILF